MLPATKKTIKDNKISYHVRYFALRKSSINTDNPTNAKNKINEKTNIFSINILFILVISFR